jgi:radical SAM superfamily enzyme YgiQ (UPF0313 family)
MEITFVAHKKNSDPTERELYEMDLLIRAMGFKRSFLDLGIHTVMACTPAGTRARLIDEYLTPIDFGVDTDVIALSAKTSCATRAYELADEFRRRGKKVILGGIHASLRPDEAQEHVDCIVTGEAEALWPSVVKDLEAGKLKPRYDARGFPPMDQIPIPSWSAETTLNVASDEEMLDLFRDAGCATLIIGFESVTEATLRDMAKPVNFCITYQEAVDRIHARGLTVVGNFIVGFDTDTRAVFKETFEFIQKTGILYPFFSILTPMPGTKLFDEFKAAGRLDHERWSLYDTRHVVFEPRHMRRDELMDGYVWLYEQTYGTEHLWDRMERSWRRRTSGSSLVEKAFLAARLAPELARGDAELRRHYKDGLKMMMSRGMLADAGQLLYVLDSYDFARFMRRSSSSMRAENYRTFAAPDVAAAAREPELHVMQWQNQKAVKRTKHSLSVVE